MVPECFDRYDFDYTCSAAHRMRVGNHQEIAWFPWAGQLRENPSLDSKSFQWAAQTSKSLRDPRVSLLFLSTKETHVRLFG
jgi:hypothetical protein